MGIMFDRYNYDPTITKEEMEVVNKFFDGMNFKKAPPATNSESGNYKTGQDLDKDGNIILAKDVDVNYGDLTKLVNFKNRWTYTGSLTTPPCTVGVYFQVVDRVLPISEEHYNAYIAHQKQYIQKDFVDPEGNIVAAGDQNNKYGRAWTKQGLDVTGNWRVTNLIDSHKVRYMRAELE